MNIGFIGLGAMGGPMAENLAAAGHTVVAWNRSSVEAPPGVRLVGSARDVGASTPVTVVMVTGPDAVEQVLFGDGGWTEGARPGATLVQCSTIGPSSIRAIGRRLEGAGFGVLDAPVSGSVGPARMGELVVLGGGDPDTFTRFSPLFDAVAKKVTVFGGVGAGSSVKLVVNAVLIAAVAGAAQGLNWLVQTEPGVGIEAIAKAFERVSPIVSRRAHDIAGDGPANGFSLSQVVKDLDLFHEEVGDDVVIDCIRDLCRAATEAGFADRDLAALGAYVRSAGSRGVQEHR